MYDILISGKKSAIGIMFLKDRQLIKSIRIVISKPENSDVNKSELLGLKYALLAVINKMIPLNLHLNTYPLRSLSPRTNPSVNKELISELRELCSSFKTVNLLRLQDHELINQVKDLATITVDLPVGATVIS
jgi:hypothetical protein